MSFDEVWKIMNNNFGEYLLNHVCEVVFDALLRLPVVVLVEVHPPA